MNAALIRVLCGVVWVLVVWVWVLVPLGVEWVVAWRGVLLPLLGS